MAGGNFDPMVGKVRPGTYINFESTRNNLAGTSERGIVVIPLLGHDYGPGREFITITNASPDSAYAKLGYSVFDDDPALNMLLIREALKHAQTVMVYIMAAGTKALGTGGGITGTAAYGGSRGNAISFSVAANPAGGFDISVFMDGSVVSAYEGIATINELISKNDPYITFSGTGDITAAAGVTLAGGEDATEANTDITAFLDAVELIKFNTLCFPVTDSALQAACKTKIMYLRGNVGRGVKAVVPNFAADYEGIINVTNSVVVDGKQLTAAQACAWVAGIDAAAGNTKSNIYVPYDGATDIVGKKTNEEAIASINKGEFFFSFSEEGTVVVECDINSLVTFTDKKDKLYRKNRVIRVFDTFGESVRANFPPGRFDNSPVGWEVMQGIGRSLLKTFLDAGAIKNVDYDADFVVDKTKSTDDETFFIVGLEPVDGAEKLYFTIQTR